MQQLVLWDGVDPKNFFKHEFEKLSYILYVLIEYLCVRNIVIEAGVTFASVTDLCLVSVVSW